MLSSTSLAAQQRAEEPYRVEASLSAGPALTLFREPHSPLSDQRTAFGAGSLLRVMWHPGRMVAFGIATGYLLIARQTERITLDSVSSLDATATLRAIPLQLAVSMQKSGFEAGVGVGPYLMMATLEDEDVTRAARLELGVTGFASYDLTIAGRLRTGPALRLFYMAYRGVLSINPEWRIRYDLVVY